MIIGGYALPFYGRIRTTIDLDVAVAVKTEEAFDQLTRWLSSRGFSPATSSFLNPLIVVLDQREHVEIELWLRPDGISFSEETLKRRRTVRLNDHVEAWIVSPEDFIINKLARPDRGAIDEQDVQSVLVRQRGKLDEDYLQRRAQETGVLQLLKAIQAHGG